MTSDNCETVAKTRPMLECERIEKATAAGKKVFLTGAPCFASQRAAAANLRKQFPEFESVLDHAGPVPSAKRLAELAEERAALLARMKDIKARIAAATAGRK